MGFERTPLELRTYRQYVAWKLQSTDSGKPTKVPYNPLSGWNANVNEPNSWVDYAQCSNSILNPAYAGGGFVLTENDPFAFIDLDATDDPILREKQQAIFKAFDSYSEISPSGTGLHILVRGMVPAGRKKYGIEIYSAKRFMTLTGNVYHDRLIEDRSEMLLSLWNELGEDRKEIVHFESQPATSTDEQVLVMGSMAPINGEKFKLLWEGRFAEAGYPSQSEADFAFIDILAIYTKNKEQIHRIFMGCHLGQRAKAHRPDYVPTMIEKAFDREYPLVNYDNFGQATFAAMKKDAAEAASSYPSKHGEHPSALAEDVINTGGDDLVNFPPGLMGQIADFIYHQSYKQYRSLSLCAAISAMAGICGRGWNTPTGAGLNLYTVLLAQTAIGKEGMAHGISKLMSAVKYQHNVAAIDEFQGPGEIASGPALYRFIEKKPCCLAILSEFGQTMQSLCHPNAAPHAVTTRKVLLDIYTKSGRGNIARASIYSDKEKNVPEIPEPAFSILAESVPGKFYESLDEAMIAQGLVARLLIVEYKGDRGPTNPNIQSVPDPKLVQTVADLVTVALGRKRDNQVRYVQWSENSFKYQKRFEIFCDKKVRANREGALRDLYGRAHLTAMKLASLIAIGMNMHEPTITGENWNYAQAMIESAVETVEKRFHVGEIGKIGPEGEQASLIQKEIANYITMFLQPKKLSATYGITEKMLTDGIIPFKYLADKLQRKTPFNPQMGFKGSACVRASLKLVCDAGTLAEVKPDRRFQYGSERLMFQIRELPEN